jgi:hypothetical protein
MGKRAASSMVAAATADFRCHSGCANGGKGVSAEFASGEGKESKGGAKKVLSQWRNDKAFRPLIPRFHPFSYTMEGGGGGLGNGFGARCGDAFDAHALLTDWQPRWAGLVWLLPSWAARYPHS